MRVYISLPISGYEITERKKHAQIMKARALAMPGVTSAITPFEICDDDTPYNECMGRDITELLGCQAILLDARWRSSPGCRAEQAVAEIYRLKQIYFDE